MSTESKTRDAICALGAKLAARGLCQRVYGGAVLYADFDGNLDSCIAIRTMLMQGKKAYLQAGAGIVADSDPAREFEESMNKAQAVLRAVDAARGGG